MSKAIHKVAAALALACSLPAQTALAAPAAVAEMPSMAERGRDLTPEECKAAWALPRGVTPKGGVLVMATFDMSTYTYDMFHGALKFEVPMMAEHKVKLISSYRVVAGKMDRYVDFWWMCDYNTFLKGFYDGAYNDTLKMAAKAGGDRASTPLLNATVEIVVPEEF